jgi:hypothetical protein
MREHESSDSKWVALSPTLANTRAFVAFGQRVAGSLRRNYLRSELVAGLREELLSQRSPRRVEEVKAAFVKHLLLDLVGQGWEVRVRRHEVQVSYPRPTDESPTASKERVRRAHLLERDARIAEPAVQEFVGRMERRRLTATGWHSVFSLMRDGRDLAALLATAREAKTAEAHAEALAGIVQPYLQFADGGAVCDHTGLPLSDIWRYFRLTWTNVHKSVPGRSMLVLVRDAAAPNHPVIGIGALGSAVVQQEIRDRWIGWDSVSFVERMVARPSIVAARRLCRRLDAMIREIYITDLIKDRVIDRNDLRQPTERTLGRLQREALKARGRHQRFPAAASLKRAQSEEDWRSAATTPLFRSKRSQQLARLLAIRRAFQQARFPGQSRADLRRALEYGAVRGALGKLTRHVKAARVGINMMDITVCGAVPPYNILLGGKLVCMLLASPEIVQKYSQRYGGQASVIASAMQARGVRRDPKLVLLCTTSLYGVGSSQYNRVRVPAEAIGGLPGDRIEYVQLGRSRGYGSFQFSSATLQEAKILLSRRIEGRRVNSIFGEGVNPLLRKIREALDLVGLESDDILRHGMPRIVYGVPLATNFRDFLLGLSVRPRYILPQENSRARTAMIAKYWCDRWLSSRLRTPGILHGVAQHTLAYPVTHGARVLAPQDPEGLALAGLSN